MITKENCYAAFLALPKDERRIKKLYSKLVADGVDPPALQTLYDWSAQNKWRARASEADGAVQIKVAEISETIEQEAKTRITLATAAEEAAFEGFACVKRALAECKIRNIKDAKIVNDIAISLAEAATVMKERGLAGALPLLEGPYAAAQLANGNDPIAKALEGLFLPPPDSA